VPYAFAAWLRGTAGGAAPLAPPPRAGAAAAAEAARRGRQGAHAAARAAGLASGVAPEPAWPEEPYASSYAAAPAAPRTTISVGAPGAASSGLDGREASSGSGSGGGPATAAAAAFSSWRYRDPSATTRAGLEASLRECLIVSGLAPAPLSPALTLDGVLAVPLPVRRGNARIALEGLPPEAAARNAPHAPLGAAAVRAAMLRYRGWGVAPVAFTEWAGAAAAGASGDNSGGGGGGRGRGRAALLEGAIEGAEADVVCGER
jgi:hypothetical protein